MTQADAEEGKGDLQLQGQNWQITGSSLGAEQEKGGRELETHLLFWMGKHRRPLIPVLTHLSLELQKDSPVTQLVGIAAAKVFPRSPH